MFTALTRVIVRHARLIIGLWVLASLAMASLALIGVGGENVFDRMRTGAPGVKGSDSAFVLTHIRDQADTNVGAPLSMIVSGVSPEDPAVIQAMEQTFTGWTRDGLALAVATPTVVVPAGIAAGEGLGPEHLAAMRGLAGDSFLVSVTTPPADPDVNVTAVHRDMIQELHAALPGSDVLAYSTPLLYEDFTSLMKQDLITGEAVALPLALIVMVLIFGGFLAASTPLIGALASIAGGLAVLYGFSYPINLDDSALNVVIVLAIGLSIDYGLLIVSRFREELTKIRSQQAGTVESALEVTMNTAGRTVFYSALTVAISVGGMLTFTPEIVRGTGAAGLGAVLMCLLTGLTLIPAVAYLLSDRLITPSMLMRWRPLRRVLLSTADVKRDEGAFSTLAGVVQRRPWLYLAAATALLLVLAAPALNIQLRNSQIELLPVDNESRAFVDTFNVEFPLIADPGLSVVADASPEQLLEWLRTDVAALPHVTGVGGVDTGDDLSRAGVYLNVTDRGSLEAVDTVDAIREMDPGFRVWVGGQAANQMDFQASLAKGAPVALGIVAVATFILLFLMTGSLLVPLKALVINALSLLATVGVVTWVFQGGHLDDLLRFTSAGGVESYVLVLILAFGFGLAMDYDLFFLARIKELVDRGVPNNEAVRIGLQRSGRIITGAAAVIILVFLGFAAGDVLVIKQVGFGLAFAVFLDATVVRMILVPSTMTLLGDYNWWAPRPLRALYRRFAITH